MELLNLCILRDRTVGAGKRFHSETIRTENEWEFGNLVMLQGVPKQLPAVSCAPKSISSTASC